VLATGVAQGMEVQKFDKMAIEDQGDYIQGLLQRAHEILVGEGKDDLAAKMHKLFTEVHQGDEMSIGMLELESNIDRARLIDAERYAKDHNARRLEVEDAMVVTLKKNGIVLPTSFTHVGDNFKPKHPLKSQ